MPNEMLSTELTPATLAIQILFTVKLPMLQFKLNSLERKPAYGVGCVLVNFNWAQIVRILLAKPELGFFSPA